MAKKRKPTAPTGDPLWYKDGIIYQTHVRAFLDSSGDGIGDFRGLTSKLDYLQDLGITAIWLLPFYPSPLRDDGYDIASYTEIHPSYGEMKDFKEFLREAHRRGLRVITELVINHTSDQHPWFQRSRQAKPGSKMRDFYVWNETPEKYADARIIFKDFETSNWSWDPVAKSYFWHRFYHHQPDLNFENPAVHRAVFQWLDLWMKMGVDGLRLDAVPYLYEREGTSCENLPQTHDFLKKLRAHVDANHENKMLLAEANQWPEDARPYFGDGDECHVAFHFPLMPRLFMSVAMEDRFPIIDIMQQTPEIPANCQWALFLRNHDELTLEMVTDEDRDYMYRTYAQDLQARINLGIRRRLAPLLGNHRRRIELMNALLFSFPGTPIIYYGDEIGMGDNIYLGDRNGVRTPMQWSPDRNAGFSRANPQRLYLPIIIDQEYHYEAVNVESQQRNPHSLLWWMKRLIDLRKRMKAFGRGTLEFLHPENRKVLVMVRRYEDEIILVVANLSRFVQGTEIDLSAYRGLTPTELFGHTEFPRITEQPYFLTITPHGFYWFALRRPTLEREALAVEKPEEIPSLVVESAGTLPTIGLEEAVAGYIRGRRWFAGKAKELKGVAFEEMIRLPESGMFLTFIRVEYRDGDAETYVLPLAKAWDDQATKVIREHKPSVLARLAGPQKKQGVLYEALVERTFARRLFQIAAGRKGLRGAKGEIQPWRLRQVTVDPQSLEPSVSRAEQSNTSIGYSDRYFLKLFRRLQRGVNVDLEVTRFLTEKTTFRNFPPLLGALEYVHEESGVTTLALLQEFVPNGGDGWRYTLDSLGRYFDRLVSHPLTTGQLGTADPTGDLFELAQRERPALVNSILGPYLNDIELLGQRTAELHLALASRPDDPAFAPEPFTPFYQRSIYQHMRTQTTRTLHLLKRKMKTMPESIHHDAQSVLDREANIHDAFRSLLDQKIYALRIRVHGDYHLGQVLQTGKDFVIIDFEGEPGRPLSERRIKRSALRDVAGMLRSFHYAPYAILLGQAPGVTVRSDDLAVLETSTRFWHAWVSAEFLKSYLRTARQGSFLPTSEEELRVLLEAYLLEKALYELSYELNNRPEWVSIPLRGILQLLDGSR